MGQFMIIMNELTRMPKYIFQENTSLFLRKHQWDQ